MNVAFACPKCEHSVAAEFTPESRQVECPHCHVGLPVPPDSFQAGLLQRCLVCPSHELFIRKDFPQELGVGIVVAGFIASSVAWFFYLPILTFAILFLTALVNVVLYMLVGGVLVCYRCNAHYRGVSATDEHGNFNLETHERHRQQAARLAEHRQPEMTSVSS